MGYELGQRGDPVLPDGLRDRFDVLRGRPCEVAELHGGLTNRNLKVTTTEGSYVLRISDPSSVALAIDRDNEYANTSIAGEDGVGAPVVARLPDDDIMLIGFIEGRTLTEEDFSLPGVIERVAGACRRLHQGARFVNDFDMFDIQRGYLALIDRHGYRLPAGYGDFEFQIEQIRRSMVTRREPTVACNNDLLAANFIDQGDQVRVIDYEYAGNNDACFELGNTWSECHLSDDQLALLITSYYGRPLRNKMARARLHGLVSMYGWTLWASIQDATSAIDFDYWTWGLEKYERAVELFRGLDFDRLLDEVQRTD
ncbi:MAG: choline/ethanolamine kinase family protein [Acidimicrobiales bacterium]